MIPNIGIGEIVVVLVIALIVLGPQKLPSVARQAGKGFREFRSAISGIDPFAEDDDAADKPPAKAAATEPPAKS